MPRRYYEEPALMTLALSKRNPWGKNEILAVVDTDFIIALWQSILGVDESRTGQPLVKPRKDSGLGCIRLRGLWEE